MPASLKPKRPLNVVLYWHMHQPDYRDLRNGEYHLPWTYLHTIKDYVDMVAHLENNEQARAVVNFAPILLEQIADYAQQLEDYLHHGKALRDPLLAALADPVLYLDPDARLRLIKNCLRANRERLIARFEVFDTLAEMAETAIKEPAKLAYYSEQYFIDILVWYHLAWMAETVRLTDSRIQTLMKQATHFSIHDRRSLIEVIHELIAGVIGRYKSLAEAGRIELSMTPYAHPILPLLIDLQSAQQAMPEMELPLSPAYPDGLARSRWHIDKGLTVFKDTFGFMPSGCWPSEGSISAETIELIGEMGLKWLASGETVLRKSLKKSAASVDECIHEVCQYRDTEVACFFRDDGLSDMIGFKYSDWHADDAVANLVHHLENIAKSCVAKPDALVSIILDGENAWEYYPENGYHFLSALYEKLAQHEGIHLTTYSDYLSTHTQRVRLPEVVAGSWVYGTFSTWIGEADKNRAWDMLVEAKKVYDRVAKEGQLDEQQLHSATMQLATCESSDWFWWLGEYNSAESVAAFDEQFRMHLSNLYQILDVSPPDYLARAFSFGCGAPAMGGAMLPGKQQ
ncbi:glycoside hydrolase family 57 protein [Sulfuriflexus mobilis]|uniref:glycoside hydrolase family 57 protein n=1 Tax=Sulfuriflexus mobilis TaxID=1811807 RepID=UPI0018D567DA|nr:glycoside hydrolase family 57 protein [Sulfuriflexus mobilis]